MTGNSTEGSRYEMPLRKPRRDPLRFPAGETTGFCVKKHPVCFLQKAKPRRLRGLCLIQDGDADIKVSGKEKPEQIGDEKICSRFTNSSK